MAEFTTQARFEQSFVVVGGAAAAGEVDRIGQHANLMAEGIARAQKRVQRELEGTVDALLSGEITWEEYERRAAQASHGVADAQRRTARETNDTTAAVQAEKYAWEEVAETVADAGGEAEEATGAFSGLGAAIAAAVAAAGLEALVSGASDAFAEINKLKLEMGVTAEQADTLGDAFSIAGVSGDEMGAALGKWSQAVRASRDAASELPKEMEKWKTIGSEALSSFPEALARVSREIEHARTEQEKLVIATNYFGESGRKLLPLLNSGEANVRAAGSGKGAFFTDKNVAQGMAFRKEMAEAADRMEDMKNSIALKLFPIIERLTAQALPVMEHAASAIASAFEFIADHAVVFEGALAAAAISWAGMKAGGLVGTLMQGGVGALGMSGVGLGIGALGALGGMAYGWLSGGDDDKHGPTEEEQRASHEAAESAAVEAAEAKATAERMVQAAERETEAMALLAKRSTLTAENLQDLGLSAGQLMSDFQAGGSAITSAAAKIHLASVTAEAGAAEADADALRKTTRFVPGIKEMRDAGKTWDEIEQKVTAFERSKVQRGMLAPYFGEDGVPTIEVAPRAWINPDGWMREGPLGGVSGLTKEDSDYITAARIAVKTLRLADAESERAKLTKLFENGKALVTTNFNGPINNTIDLRGEDPDRVMFGITDNLLKLAANRTMSRFAPVGL